MSKRICRLNTNADIMRMKMQDIEPCSKYSLISLRDLQTALRKQNRKVLLINTERYRNWVTQCQRCMYFLGKYPTWSEARRDR